MEAFFSQGATWRRHGTMDISYTGRGFIVVWERKFYNENNNSMQKTPQGCGRVFIVGSFQYIIGQGDR